MKADTVYRRDEKTCQYCGNGSSSLDHLLPRSMGGTDTYENLVSACGTCNMLKGDTHYPHLVESMQTLLLQGRSSSQHYPPLYWQVQTLGMPHEELETNPNQGRWFERTILKLLFYEPGRDTPRSRRHKTTALRILSEEVPWLDLEGAAEELEHLCSVGRLRLTAQYCFPVGEI